MTASGDSQGDKDCCAAHDGLPCEPFKDATHNIAAGCGDRFPPTGIWPFGLSTSVARSGRPDRAPRHTGWPGEGSPGNLQVPGRHPVAERLEPPAHIAGRQLPERPGADVLQQRPKRLAVDGSRPFRPALQPALEPVIFLLGTRRCKRVYAGPCGGGAPRPGGGSAVRDGWLGRAVVRGMAAGWPGPGGWGSRACRSGRSC
jgi:hypothetical protein